MSDDLQMPLGIPDDSESVIDPGPGGSVPVPTPLTTAVQQATPGTNPGKKQGPQSIAMSKVVPRGTLANSQTITTSNSITGFSEEQNFEKNLAILVQKDLELAHHDRSLAIALLQTHLERAEILDAMALSMPVAAVIADNSGVILKSLELSMRAGERVHKTAELLVNAQKNADGSALAALKVQLEMKKGDGGWGDDIPGENP